MSGDRGLLRRADSGLDRPGERRAPLGAAVFALLALAACASTRILEQWKDPTFSGPLRFHKVVVMVISPDTTVQRVAEDELVRQLGADRAVAAYTIVDEETRRTPEAVLAAIDHHDADGLVVMRLVDTKEDVRYVPGGLEPFPTYYRAGYGYAYNGYGLDTGYVTTQTHVRVETRIYSVAGQRLLWSGISDTVDPKDLRRLVAEIADAVGNELRKEGLLESREKER
ncbi:MAG TPA: hypothetical protein VMW19_18445 [Myxococcota bacterium]|nr:hypothetical protein [Myxococcota bacterium]